MDEGTIDWLLDGDPAIRWQVMADLVGADETAVAEERSRVAVEGWGADLLSRRDPQGTWGGGLYGPKWISTTYTLLLLWRCGLPPIEEARNGVRLLFEGARYQDGGLTPAAGSAIPEACVTAMYVTLAAAFEFEDRRADDALSWLLDNQLEDGGWNCERLRSGDRHSSFHTTISALEALTEVSRTRDNRAVGEAIARGHEFFLVHRLYKSHHTGDVVNDAFSKLSFPPRWHYDVLRGLDHFQRSGAPWDRRLAEAIDLLQAKRRRDGRWPVQNKHAGRVWFDMEVGRGPSRWNTLRALRVLRWVDQAQG